jgi:hypothetical protein
MRTPGFWATWDGVKDRVHFVLCAACTLACAIWLLIFSAVIHHFWPTVFPQLFSVSHSAAEKGLNAATQNALRGSDHDDAKRQPVRSYFVEGM